MASAGGKGAKGRDHFTEAEINALLRLQTLSVRDRLTIRIMAETGLRRRAVSWLMVEERTRSFTENTFLTLSLAVTRVFYKC